MLDGHHSDGEVMGVGELELLRVLLPRTCEHCTGWMRPDSHDPGEFVCANCGRGTFCPAPEIVAEEPQPATPDPVGHLVPRAVPRAPRSRTVRAGLAEGKLVIGG